MIFSLFTSPSGEVSGQKNLCEQNRALGFESIVILLLGHHDQQMEIPCVSHWHQSSLPGIGDPFTAMWGPNGDAGQQEQSAAACSTPEVCPP